MSTRRHSAVPRRNKIVTTVNLEPEVLEYLAELQQEFDRDRSYLVNALVKEYRRRRQHNGSDAGKETLSKSLLV